jgi:hypothetical protein
MKIIYVPEPLIWEPEKNITTYELALNAPLVAATTKYHLIYQSLPPEAQRHWKPYLD